MSDVAVTAEQVGTIVTYVAPGFLARTAYRARLPDRDRPASEALLVSVVLSLPIVTLCDAIIPGEQKPTQAGYVAALLIVSFLGGYLAAAARSTRRVRQWLATTLGHELAPPGSTYLNVFRDQPEEAAITVIMKDGRRYSGSPVFYPSHASDGVTALYLTYPQVASAGGTWVDVGGEGLILPLTEISAIVIDEDSMNKDAS